MENNGKDREQKRRFRVRLKYQIIAMIVFGLMVPSILIMIFLVGITSRENKESSMRVAFKTAEQISENMDMMNRIVYSTSDNFWDDTIVDSVTSTDYGSDYALKRARMGLLKRRLMEDAVFPITLGIGAIYTPDGQLFNLYTGQNIEDGRILNFYDPLPEDRMEWFRGFHTDDTDKLAVLHWYSLQPNYFQEKETGNPRLDHILLGSRRTYNIYFGYHINTHIFIVPEQTIYDQYKGYLKEGGQQAFILDKDRKLISASNEDYLSGETALPGIFDGMREGGSGSYTVRNGAEEHLISYACSEYTGWYTVIDTQARSVTGPFWALLGKMLAVSLLLFLVLIGGIFIFSRHISAPLEEMSRSMRKVEQGNFVPAPANTYQNEIGQITYYYNRMVVRLERLIRETYEKEKKSKELEAKVLMGQINPHFIYNTLETIVWKANQAKLPDVAKTASQLGRLLRYSVKNDTFVIPLQQEIQQTGIYFNIQKMRYKERISFEIQPFEESLKQVRVLRLILQPSVENAIVHGMNPGGEPLHIRIGIRREEDGLLIRVEDDGCGMEEGRLREVLQYIHGKSDAVRFKSSGTGIGIRNIHERIHLYFGDSYGVEMESAPQKGTVMIIRLPYLPPEEEGQESGFPGKS